MQMAEGHVLTCLADDCSYNCREVCCAPAVEVGEDHPACDTFTTGAVEIRQAEPGVRDCKVMDCHFNSSESCMAAGVTMITHSGHADCATFRH
ncbi:MAG: DUF1540 domain-containing protein [Coriobacteriia bacterium]|nr:DUF1540 domain-containing protein [Coriobacteriia bacterium]